MGNPLRTATLLCARDPILTTLLPSTYRLLHPLFLEIKCARTKVVPCFDFSLALRGESSQGNLLMEAARLSTWVTGLLGWIIALVVFFPILVMAVTAFKTESDAYQFASLFTPTLQSFRDVFARDDYRLFLLNSISVSFGSTLCCFLVAVPCAYRMAFFPTLGTTSTLLWMISTKMMPAGGALVPVYLILRTLHGLDTVTGLIVIYTLMNLPLAVWMTFNYFCEVPAGRLEAARIDEAGFRQEVWNVLVPMALPGMFSTALLLITLAWNEAFWSLRLTSFHAAPLTNYIASFTSGRGLFWAKVSAASLLSVAPIMVLGLAAQKSFIRGFTSVGR